MKPDGKFKFGEWLPDQPDLDNPGLIEAVNVLPINGNYAPYQPILGTGTAIPELPLASRRVTSLGGSTVYAGTSGSGLTKLYFAAPPLWIDKTPGVLSYPVFNWNMVQYDARIYVTNGIDTPLTHLNGGGANFANVTGIYGAAPICGVLGIIGQFLIAGDIKGIAPYAVRWSGINAPFNWPTPGTTAAIAEQSGIQYLEPDLGTVVGIAQGDQWGLILLDGGMVRATYAGGNVVFQFDTIQRAPGCIGPNSWCKFGSTIYSAGSAGFFATDGVNVIPIGREKVDGYFASVVDFNYPNNVRCGIDWGKRLIYWTYPKTGNSGVPNEMMVYNIDEKRFTHVQDDVQCFVAGEEANYRAHGTEAFDLSNNKLGVFSGTPGTATLTSMEVELVPGKRAQVNSVTPQVTGTTSVTARIGSRTLQSDSVTYTGVLTPDPKTGDCNQIVDDRYHRVEFDIAGTFNQAIGGEFDFEPSSEF